MVKDIKLPKLIWNKIIDYRKFPVHIFWPAAKDPSCAGILVTFKTPEELENVFPDDVRQSFLSDFCYDEFAGEFLDDGTFQSDYREEREFIDFYNEKLRHLPGEEALKVIDDNSNNEDHVSFYIYCELVFSGEEFEVFRGHQSIKDII